MRFLLVDPEGVGLSWARRCYDEADDVLYYVLAASEKRVGDSIVPKISSLHGALAWAKEEPTIAVFLSSGMGKRGHEVPVGADDFRKAGVPVIGGGSFCDKLEKDRLFGEEVARACGMHLPDTKEFSTVSQAIAFCRMQGENEWYFKTDKYLDSDATQGGTGEQLVRYLEHLREKYGDSIANILQRKIDGVAISTACWWNGRAFVLPYEGTIEHKKFLNGDLGPSTGCAFNAVWFYNEECPKVVCSLGWEKLTPIFLKHDAPPCLYDINAIISDEDGEAYFLEWTPRCGWDSEATSQKLFTGNLTDFFMKLVDGKIERLPVKSSPSLAYSIRLSVSPYPWEHNEGQKKSCLGTPVHGIDGLWDEHFIAYALQSDSKARLSIASPNGLLGLSSAVGTNLTALHKRVIEFAEGLEPKSLQYRTDGDKVISKDAKQLKGLGYEIPAGMLK